MQMNFSQRSYLPNLDGKQLRSSIKNLVEPKKPLDFLSFDDSEIFCDIPAPRLSESIGKSPIPKKSKTLAAVTSGRSWNRKQSEGRLKSIVLGTTLNQPRVEEMKTVIRGFTSSLTFWLR